MKDLTNSKEFIGRHIGPSDEHIKTMLSYLNVKSLDELIKKIVPGPHRNLEFKDAGLLMTNIRAKLDDSMADEANLAFDWAIRMMKDYDTSLG
jgi:glycine cleavage system pyridoxal-binding protein P